MSFSRREFLVALGAAAAASALPGSSLANATRNISFGYAAITWNGNDVQAIKEISEVGFKGIQLRTSVLPEFEKRPAALRELLAANHLKFTAFSSGGIGIAPGTESTEIAKHVRNATFVRDAGGLYLQVTDSARQKDRKPIADDFKTL